MSVARRRSPISNTAAWGELTWHKIPFDVCADFGEDVLGLSIWDRRDRSGSFSAPGARGDEDFRADDHAQIAIVLGPVPLLTFNTAMTFHGNPAIYSLNLLTFRPTKASPNQSAPTDKLVDAIKLATGRGEG